MLLSSCPIDPRSSVNFHEAIRLNYSVLLSCSYCSWAGDGFISHHSLKNPVEEAQIRIVNCMKWSYLLPAWYPLRIVTSIWSTLLTKKLYFRTVISEAEANGKLSELEKLINSEALAIVTLIKTQCIFLSNRWRNDPKISADIKRIAGPGRRSSNRRSKFPGDNLIEGPFNFWKASTEKTVILMVSTINRNRLPTWRWRLFWWWCRWWDWRGRYTHQTVRYSKTTGDTINSGFKRPEEGYSGTGGAELPRGNPSRGRCCDGKSSKRDALEGNTGR